MSLLFVIQKSIAAWIAAVSSVPLVPFQSQAAPKSITLTGDPLIIE
jgi:hypothetical protein